ncbi:MAG: sulfatase-like hydrolase/transferase [Planctomycetes bacterium]|nr:sulfatase-like hydrolase/transferase [Planctomycetota bacterium]
MKRPNVLLMYTDQQRWDALGCSGNEHIRTPNLDALAAGGALMKGAFANNPVCMPSRQSMLSSLYPSVTGTMVNGIEMPQDILTVHKVLKPYGYHTANIGKLHFKNHSNRDHREHHPSYGFDTLILSDEPGCYDDAYMKWVAQKDPSQVWNCRVTSPPARKTDRIEKQPRVTTAPYVFEGPEELTHSSFVADETIAYINRHKDGPFFAIAGFYAPHAPINPPQRFVDMYNQADMPLPMRNEGEDQHKLSDNQWRKIKAYYYALISHVDDQVGRILSALDEAGLRDNTIVIFTSDHGDHLGDHGIVAKGPPGFDSCTHVPLIFSYPSSAPAGAVKTELIEAVDIVPTILDYCGVQIPPVMQGRSFRPLLAGGDYKPRDSIYIESRRPFAESYKVVRTHEHWYCADNSGKEILFDLDADPHQLHDVAGSSAHAGALNQMRRELIRRWFSVERQYPLRTGSY